MAHEVFQYVPFPFPDNQFPHHLGAVAQRTVTDRNLPALTVIHTADNSWVVLDGITDPNADGARVVEAMIHLVEDDPSLAVLARLAVGHRADREQLGGVWHVSTYEMDD